MLCRSCGKIIPLTPVECPQCGARQERTAVPSKPNLTRAHVAGALVFGLVSGFAGGFLSARPGSGPVTETKIIDMTPPPSLPRGTVNHKIVFKHNSPELTPDGETILGRVADTLRYYPLDSIDVVGYAGRAENDVQSLATARAFLVKAMLVDRHGVPKERVRTQTKVVPDAMANKAEVYIIAGPMPSVGSAQ
ncbi:MAG: OmpA family protein [Elusimicrobiota bacterium]